MLQIKTESTDAEVVTNGDAKNDDDDGDDTEPELIKVQELSSVPGHLKLDLDDSRQPFSPIESRTGTPVISLAPTSMAINPAVKELALALLKVGVSVIENSFGLIDRWID